MPTIKLTKKHIETTRANLNGRSVYLWDAELRGFGCRVTKGKVSWLIKKRLGEGGRQSKQVWSVIGDYSELPLEKARDKAIAIISQVRQGADLADRKRQARVAQNAVYQSGKLEDVFNSYYAMRSEQGRYWQETKRLFEVEVLPRIGKETVIAHITKRELRQLVEAKALTAPGVARLLFATMRPFFKWCSQRELIQSSPMDGLEPPKNLPSRDRVLSDAEVIAIWNATLEPSVFHSFYRVLLLTGQRRDEVAGMTKRELDLGNGIWTIPGKRTKNGKEHTVHLSPLVVSILSKCEGEFLFSTNGTSPIRGYSKAKRQLDARLDNVAPWRVHDLRRTAASGMARLGYLPHVIERVLNHVSGSTGGLVGVYQRYDYLEDRKQALLSWSSYLERLVAPDEQ